MPRPTTKRRTNEPKLDDMGIPIQEEPVQETPLDSKVLMEQIASLNTRLDTYERERMALLTQPSPTYTAPGPVDKKENVLDGLPDPVLEPDAFKAALPDRINAQIAKLMEAKNAEVQAQNAQNGRYAALWDDFKTGYKDYADNERLVAFAAQTVGERAKLRGMDLDRYMFGTKDAFFKDVVAELETLGVGPKEPEPDPDDDAGRTNAIFGGFEGSPAAGHTKVEDAGDMIKELQEQQKQLGIF